uniref:Plus3 domain-containing protein n=1 Tax=Meloidogyne incognita TaxID=6306 RepID=A0A914L8M8_MELIC
MSTTTEEIQSSAQKRKAEDSPELSPNSNKKQIEESDIVPKTPEELDSLLIPIDYARQLLSTPKERLPLKKLRVILVGCWMRYQAVRDRSKNPLTSFFIDKVIHVNRDGLRFKNTRENSYRSIIKLKECVNPLDDAAFKLWLDDLSSWNIPVPSIHELKTKREEIERTIEEYKSDNLNNSNEALESTNCEKEAETRIEIKNENVSQINSSLQPDDGKQTETNVLNENTGNSTLQSTSEEQELPNGLTKEDIAKMVVTMDDLCRLLDYGKDVFERVATGFFVEIRAPPNPNNKKAISQGRGKLIIYLDQIIGVNWMGKPYLVYEKPMTLSLRFRHFRDEKLKLLPFRDRNTLIDQKAIDQWLYDTVEWEEEFPTKEFIEQKCEELKNVFSEPPKGPPIDLMKMVDGDNSARQLRKIMAWQREQQDVNRPRHSSYPPHNHYSSYSGPYNQSPYSMQGPHRYPQPLNQAYPPRPSYGIPPLAHNYNQPNYHQYSHQPMNRPYYPNSNQYPAYPRQPTYGQRQYYW